MGDIDLSAPLRTKKERKEWGEIIACPTETLAGKKTKRVTSRRDTKSPTRKNEPNRPRQVRDLFKGEHGLAPIGWEWSEKKRCLLAGTWEERGRLSLGQTQNPWPA